jgi:hypothetical protein
MNRRFVGGAVLALIAVLAGSTRTYAIFGIGDIVFDPSNYAQAVKQVIQMEQQYAQLVQSYRMLRSQYEHLVWMAKRVPVNMAVRYRARLTPWKTFSAGSGTGPTAAWVAAVNTGLSVPAAYLEATARLIENGTALSRLPSEQRAHLRTAYGTVELTDGANLNALETVGQLRANSVAVEAAIERLEEDSLSGEPDMNTQIAVLNKINAAHLVSVRTTQDANKLLVALAEQQVLQAKRVRDAEARGIHHQARFVAEGKAILTAQAAGASQALRDWRMP